VLNRDDAKEMQNGHIDKVMAEEKNRQGDENEEWNKDETSRTMG
jgi:hypothetical protein